MKTESFERLEVLMQPYRNRAIATLEDLPVALGRSNVVADSEKNENDFRERREELLADLRRFLSSAIFKDIGPVTAKRIVSAFGLRTAQVIKTSPQELVTVKGVGSKRVQGIRNGWTFQKRLVAECEELVALLDSLE